MVDVDILNFEKDVHLTEETEQGWSHIDTKNTAPGPFMGSPGLIQDSGRKPEDFFNTLFNERMWVTIAEQTNVYARQKIRKARGNRDVIDATTHHSHKKHSRLNSWKDINACDVKVFMAHVMLMGLTRKGSIQKYWSTSEITSVPFFGKYMSRNQFQNILWNLHIADNTNNPQNAADPLYKLRDFITMTQDNFKFVYKPGQNISLDEACCPFKGRLRFKVYNPRKPKRFHIKLFQACESQSGYIIGFEIYTGKNLMSCSHTATVLDTECTRTTKLVHGLLEELNLLDRGHHVYFDNYYSSPELLEELLYRETYCCGTVRSNRRGLPKSVTSPKLKPGQSVFRKKESCLVLKWCDKRAVTMITSIHDATELMTRKLDNDGNRKMKPTAIVEYTKLMSGVDLSDQVMASYSILRKSTKWWRTLFLHLFSMIVLNAHILNRKFGHNKLTHEDFREYLAKYLLETGLPGANCKRTRPQTANCTVGSRLSDRHFPSCITAANGAKRHKPSRLCVVCNLSQKEIADRGLPLFVFKRKWTSYQCAECNAALCIVPCFGIYHTAYDYKNAGFAERMKV